MKNKKTIFMKFIIILLGVLFVSWVIGVGVKVVPNYLTYGTSSEWFSFWGNISGGLISAGVAAYISYVISTNESKKSLIREQVIVRESALINIKIEMLADILCEIKKMKEYSDDLGIIFLNIEKGIFLKKDFEITLEREELDELINKLQTNYLNGFFNNNSAKTKMNNIKTNELASKFETYFQLFSDCNDDVTKFVKSIPIGETATIDSCTYAHINDKLGEIQKNYDLVSDEYYKEYFELNIDDLKRRK